MQIKIERRKERIIQEIQLFSIKLPRPRAVTSNYPIFQLEQYTLAFNLVSYRINDTLISVTIQIHTKQKQKRWSNYRQKISLFEFVNFIAYLEECVKIAKQNIPFETFLFSVYNAEKSHVFSLKAGFRSNSLQNQENLQLYFKLKNVLDYSEDLDRCTEESLDMEIESPVSFENILNFTSSVRDFLIEAYVKDDLTVKPSESIFSRAISF